MALLRPPKNALVDLKTGLPTVEWLYWLQTIASSLDTIIAAIAALPGAPDDGASAGSGTVGRLAKWVTSKGLGDSIVAEDGDILTVDGTLVANTLQGELDTSYLVGLIPYSQLALFGSVVDSDIVTVSWSKITGTPTTLAGYGITDAAPLVHTHTFASLTAKPTTLAGYGIVDAQPLNAKLTAYAALAPAVGVLTNDGAGVVSWGPGGGGGGGTPNVEYRGEVPTGAVNGANTVYTTAHTYLPGLLAVYLNGQRLTLTADYAETTSTTFTMVTAPATGDVVTEDYVSVSGSGGGGGGSGAVVQVAQTETGAVATGGTIIPFDDTIPQNTEGDQFLSLAITPTSAANRLRIDVSCFAASNAANWITAALFQDATASALAAFSNYQSVGGGGCSVAFTHFMTAGTTAPTTFKVRAGRDASAGSLVTFNGSGGGRFLGGVFASSLTITEVTP